MEIEDSLAKRERERDIGYLRRERVRGIESSSGERGYLGRETEREYR